jgi:hypothetical protein
VYPGFSSRSQSGAGAHAGHFDLDLDDLLLTRVRRYGDEGETHQWVGSGNSRRAEQIAHTMPESIASEGQWNLGQ